MSAGLNAPPLEAGWCEVEDSGIRAHAAKPPALHVLTARVARPPNGKLSELVIQHIAEEMRITPKRVRELVFSR